MTQYMVKLVCGINGYFVGGKNENNCACGAKNFPRRERKFTHILVGGGGMN